MMPDMRLLSWPARIKGVKMEHKYRMFNRELLCWLYWSVEVSAYPDVDQLARDIFFTTGDIETLSLYTGKKDKNSKEIYGRDIICGYQHNPDKKWVVELKISEYNCGFVGVDPKCESSYIHVWYDDLEIIGNDVENPEMLETKQGEK